MSRMETWWLVLKVQPWSALVLEDGAPAPVERGPLDPIAFAPIFRDRAAALDWADGRDEVLQAVSVDSVAWAAMERRVRRRRRG